jgi:hypothetical protein
MPVSGSVTNATGSVKGISCTGLVDAYTGNWGGSGGTYDDLPSVGGGTAQVAARDPAVRYDRGVRPGGRRAAAYAAERGDAAADVFVAYADLPNGVATIPPAAADLPLTVGDDEWLGLEGHVRRGAPGVEGAS